MGPSVELGPPKGNRHSIFFGTPIMLKGRGGRSQSESVNSRNGCNGIIRSDKIEEEKPRRERDTGEETVGYQVNTGEVRGNIP